MQAVEIERHRPYLLKYAQLHLRDASAAEDAVQETLLAALVGAQSFGGQSAVRTWLIGILKHKIVDHFRRSKRETPLQPDDDDTSLEDLDRLFRENGHYRDEPQNWPSPDEALNRKEFFSALEICLNALPPKAAQAFTLHEVMGMSTIEICKELHITSTNCWVLLYRARMALRLCLEKGWFGSEGASR